MEEINFGKFGILIASRQIITHHFEPLCACSMAHGHKFAKLKPTNHQNFSNLPKFLPYGKRSNIMFLSTIAHSKCEGHKTAPISNHIKTALQKRCG